MRIKNLLCITLLLSSNLISAQDEAKLDVLKTPSSPASNILGMKPGTTLAPKSYQALEAALYSNFINDNSLSLPDDFSLEFTPYWVTHNGLSLDDYLGKESLIDQFKRNSSFSIASTRSYYLADSTKTNSLSFGYRTSFFIEESGSKQKGKELLNVLDFNLNVQSDMGPLVLDALKGNPNDGKEFHKLITPLLREYFENADLHNEVIEKIIAEAGLKLESLTKENLKDEKLTIAIVEVCRNVLEMEKGFNNVKNYLQNRYGLTIDIAYANFLNFPTNDFEYSIVPKQSIWVTPSYRFGGKLKDFKLMGVFRYQWSNTSYFNNYFANVKPYKHNVDYGLAVTGDFNRFSANFEIVGRNGTTEIAAGTDDDNNQLYRKENSSDIQYLGTLSYRLSDQIVLSYTLGKNFEIFNNSQNNLVSLLSLNLGFGAPSIKSSK